MRIYGMHGVTEIRNLTPHEVSIAMRESDPLTIPPDGLVARVEEELESSDYLPGGLEFYRVKRGRLNCLPQPRVGVLLIVSRVVLDWAHYEGLRRGDLVSPAKLCRDEKGQIVACEGLMSNLEPPFAEGHLVQDVFVPSGQRLVQDKPTGLLTVKLIVEES